MLEFLYIFALPFLALPTVLALQTVTRGLGILVPKAHVLARSLCQSLRKDYDVCHPRGSVQSGVNLDADPRDE